MSKIKILLVILISISFSSLAKTESSLKIDLSTLKELKEENLISKQRYDSLKQEYLQNTAITRNKTLGGTAVINGHVQNTSGTAIEGESIILYELLAGKRIYIDVRITSVSGDFSFTGLNAGRYIIYQSSFTDDYLDYMWSSSGNIVCTKNYGICREPQASNYIDISAAEIRNGIDFTLALGGKITGTLTDNLTSAAVSTLKVIVVDYATGMQNYYLGITPDPITGFYEIKGVPDGNYQVYLENDISSGNTHIPQIYGGSECNLCFSLAYQSLGTQLTINMANTINNIDFSLNVGASISGRLVDGSTLTAMANTHLIILFDDLNTTVGYQYVFGTDNDPTADGSYFLGGLIPGSYYIQGGSSGYYQREIYNNIPCYFGGCYRNLGNPVVLGPFENRTGINFDLDLGGLISGTVTEASSGLPLSLSSGSLLVEFIDNMGNVKGSAYVNGDGTYVSNRGLPAGSYSVRTGSMFLGNLTAPYVNEKYNDIPCAALACDFTTPNVNVTVGVTTPNIDFALAQGNTFTGTVTDLTTSAPIAGVNILVYKDMGGGVVKFANWATTGDGSVGSLPVGEFEVSGLPDGTYYARTGYGSDLPFFVSSYHNIGGAAPIGWIDILYDGMPCLADCDVTLGTPIVLPTVVKSTKAKAAPIINFGLLQGAVITGQVTNFIQNTPIKEVTVNVYNSMGTFMGSSITNELGEYITRGLPTGTYYLTTTTDAVLLDVKYGNDFCNPGNCDPLDAQPISVSGTTTTTNKNFILKTAYMHVFSDSFE
jgi:hypothetical protein